MTCRSISEVNGYQSCPRKWWIRYVKRRSELLPAGHLNRGKRIHAGLEVLDRFGMGMALAEVQGPVERAMLKGYEAVYPQRLQAQHNVRFRIQVAHGLEMVGELDGLTDGKILERKTTSHDISPGSEWWHSRIHTDPQPSVYSIAFPGRPVLYDVLRTPQLRQYGITKTRAQPETDEAFEARILEDMALRPEHYFARQEIVRLESEAVETITDLIIVNELMLDWELPAVLHTRPQRNPHACFTYGSRCGFFEYCWQSKELDSVTQPWQGHELHWVAEERFQ